MNGIDVSAVDFDGLISREWLITNGLGGYASSSIPGLNTRKYHGLLVAAMSPPVRRMVLLSRVEESVTCGGKIHDLPCNEYPGTIHPCGQEYLKAFNPSPFPRWAYQGDGWTIEKCVRLLQGENTVCISYTLLAGRRDVQLAIRPMLALRTIHELMYQWNGSLRSETKDGYFCVPPTSRTPEVFFAHDGDFAPEPLWYLNTIYRREVERGYSGLEDLWTPGVVRWILHPGQTVHVVCSTEPVELGRVVSEANRQAIDLSAPLTLAQPRDTTLQQLVRAASMFGPAPKCGAFVTQFPWAAPSVRDALIALPGVLLVTGRTAEAKSFLEFLVSKLDAGLMPSEFPEDGGAPIYRGADVSLWFIYALHQLMRYDRDVAFLRRMYPAIVEIIEKYQHGTHLGIGVDSESLLVSRAPGIGSTWMDAMVDQQPVTSRMGRPVELNALWYNALCAAASMARLAEQPTDAENFTAMSIAVRVSFNRRFWNADADCCFDVVDESGNDAALRPNQLLALSLPFAVLSTDRHRKVLSKVRSELLVPTGVRTLSPHDRQYHGRCAGNANQRDRAAHEGSAYPWLLGQYVTALLKLNGRGVESRQQALRLLQPCISHLNNVGLGHLGDVFDGNAPHKPAGAHASARAIGEILRCYVEDVLDLQPNVPQNPQPNFGIDVNPTVKS